MCCTEGQVNGAPGPGWGVGGCWCQRVQRKLAEIGGGGVQGRILPNLLVDDVERGVEEELVLLVHRGLLLLRGAHPTFRGERKNPSTIKRDIPVKRLRGG